MPGLDDNEGISTSGQVDFRRHFIFHYYFCFWKTRPVIECNKGRHSTLLVTEVYPIHGHTFQWWAFFINTMKTTFRLKFLFLTNFFKITSLQVIKEKLLITRFALFQCYVHQCCLKAW